MPRPTGVQFLQGNEASLWGALDAGARFFAGYPITPSSEIAELACRELPVLNGIYLQMEDEIASIAAITGASLSGKKSFTATSGPGFSLMQENLGVAIYEEVPCVIVHVQRVGPSTGMATRPAQGDVMQTRWGTHGDHPVIALCPSSVQEMYELTVRAFNLSEKYRTPVIVLSDEIVAHLREKITLPEPEEIEIINRKTPQGPPEGFLPYAPDADGIPPMGKYGDPHIVHASSTSHDYSGYSNFTPEVADALIRRIHRKIYDNLNDIITCEKFGPEEADITLIAYGATARTAKQAVIDAGKKGLKVNLLRLITIWPFADEQVAKVLEKAKNVIVPEMNLGQIVLEVERANKSNTPVHLLSRVDGELITPEQILARIQEVAINDL